MAKRFELLRGLAMPLLAAFPAFAEPPLEISRAERTSDGCLVHTVSSEYQSGPTKIRVLPPDRTESGRRYPVLYVLPVEAGDGTRWGDGLAEVKQHDLANRHGLICVAPTFSQLPWYADHPSDPAVRQESYLLEVVIPFVDREYPTRAGAEDRLLLGFSKSGWGAWSLLLRHPDRFGKAVAWDAPLMMEAPGRYGSGPIFGDPGNFENYRLTSLLRSKGMPLRGRARLIHFGYGGFRNDHERMHALMGELGIEDLYRDGPKRDHSWHSGWLPEAVEMLVGSR